jgi:hypothetical protein
VVATIATLHLQRLVDFSEPLIKNLSSAVSGNRDFTFAYKIPLEEQIRAATSSDVYTL